MSTSESPTASDPSASGSTLRAGVAALALSLVVNWALAFVAIAAGVAPALTALNYGPITFLTTVGVVGATAVYAVLARTVTDPDRVFAAVAAVVLVASVIPDFTFIPSQPGGSLLAGVVLAALHVTTAAICVAALTDYGPDVVGRL
jgi:hypothetical protein